MNYYFSTRVNLDFDDAVSAVTEALKGEVFGVLTEIDVKETFKNKLDVDFRPYKILGACHPSSAHRAITNEPFIGLMLPCNVIVQETNGVVEVSAIDPIASMLAVDNPKLAKVGNEVRDKLQNVIKKLS